jgi:hypothetical protein
VSASAATSNAGSPGEAPRMALQSMINNMAVLGPKSEKRSDKTKKQESSESSDSSESEDSSKDEEAGNGKGQARKGKGAGKKKNKKGKESQSTKRVDSRGVMLLCAGDAIHFAPLRSNFHFIFLFGRKRPSGICSKNCRS